jgi:hypothetical protein
VSAIANFVGNDSYDAESRVDGHLKNFTDFVELGGDDDTPVGTLVLDDLDTAVITMDLGGTARNLTYGEHWRLSVYINCKPCPPRYRCLYDVDPPTCKFPTMKLQVSERVSAE